MCQVSTVFTNVGSGEDKLQITNRAQHSSPNMVLEPKQEITCLSYTWGTPNNVSVSVPREGYNCILAAELRYLGLGT